MLEKTYAPDHERAVLWVEVYHEDLQQLKHQGRNEQRQHAGQCSIHR